MDSMSFVSFLSEGQMRSGSILEHTVPRQHMYCERPRIDLLMDVKVGWGHSFLLQSDYMSGREATTILCFEGYFEV